MKGNITVDDIRLRSKLTNNKTIRLTKECIFQRILGFMQSHPGRLGRLGDIESFVQLIPGTYRSDKPINITGIDEFLLKCDCNDGSIVNGLREPLLNSFALTSPPGQKIYNQPKIKLLKKGE